MGRPLNKKYFGNTNTDDIGGRSVTGVTVASVGSYVGTLPTVTFPAPGIYEGTTATGAVHGNALSATVSETGSGYAYGNVLTVTGGTKATAATFTVTSLVVSTINAAPLNGGSNNDVGDEFEFSGSYSGGSWTTPLKVRVTASTLGVATAVQIVTPGVWAGSAAPANTTGATRRQTFGTIDMNGTGLQVTITAWNIRGVTVAQQGDYTAVPANPAATTVAPAGGTGATLAVTYGVGSIAITNAGSGYVITQSLGVTFAPPNYAGAAGTTVLGSAPNPSVILLTAATQTSTPYNNSDIIKQQATSTYKVINQGGTAFCNLQASTPDAPGEATMAAVDSGGSTYYVVKLCAHLATLVQKTDSGSGFEFRSMTNPVWTLGSPVAGYSVQIYND